MRSRAAQLRAANALATALESGVCDEATARVLYALGRDAVTLALLAAARRITNQSACIADQNARIADQKARIAQLQARLAAGRDPTAVTPRTPSGMQPVYTKPNVPPRQPRPGQPCVDGDHHCAAAPARRSRVAAVSSV